MIFTVLRTVEFHNDASRSTGEINDVTADWNLPLERQAHQSVSTEAIPKFQFRLGLRPPHGLRILADLHRNWRVGWHGQSPPSVLPDISPTRGEIGGFGHAAHSARLEMGAEAKRRLISPLVEEMSGRTEGGATRRDLSDDPKPIVRERAGLGSYEDPAEQKRRGRRTGKTGRPGR